MLERTRVILGIDAGTTSVKTVAFALDGQILGVARSAVHILRTTDGRAEVDMNHLWDAVSTTIVAVVEEIGDVEILAIGITGQGDGAWLVDHDHQPVRPAVLWLDGRANDRLATWLLDGRAEAVHAATGSPLFAGALPLLLDELAEAEPEARAGMALQLNCKDWLRFKLTQEVATDPSEASRTYLDTATGAYSTTLLEALGQSDIRRALPDVRDPQSIAGRVTEHAAASLGLKAGIPVVVGLVDTAAAGVGLGAIGDGQGYAILGTTGFVGVNHASRADVKSETSIVLSTGRGAQVLESMAPMTGTPNLDWVRACLGLDGQGWAEVETQAASVRPGSGGVIYLPYGAPSGERAPFFDPAASASWLGMSVTTNRAELLRSVYEGLAYSLNECLEILCLTGQLLVCGGGSESDLLCGILSDVTGRDIVRLDEPEVGARGVACLAMVAAGLAPTLRGAVDAMASTARVFTPDPVRSALYGDAYRTFIRARNALRPHWSELRELRVLSQSASGESSEPPLLASPAQQSTHALLNEERRS